jgi:hypothetical protein
VDGYTGEQLLSGGSMSIIDHAKEIADLIKKYNDQDLYERIVGLREEILALREENLTLREEVKAGKVAADVSSRLRRDGNCYFFDDDKSKERPFCLTCWDADRRLISLIVSPGYVGEGTIRCGRCDRMRGTE